MSFNSRIERLEDHTSKPGIHTWIDLMKYDGSWPAVVSDQMAPLMNQVKK